MRWTTAGRGGSAVWILIALMAVPALADWGFQRKDVEASNRQELPADMSEAPGISTIYESDQRSLPNERAFVDANRDGSLDILMPFRGSLGLFDPAAGGFSWVSPNLGIDGLVGLGDFDGDGDDSEVLALSRSVGGGLHIIDLESGALLASITGLTELSGVRSSEVALYDFDGDGSAEIVFAANIGSLGSMWVARFHTDYSGHSLLELEYGGYNQTTIPRVGRLFPDDQVGIALHQGFYYSLWTVCDASEPDVLCDPQTGELCFCEHGRTDLINPVLQFEAPEHVVDMDGDGDEEMIEIMGRAPWGRAVQLFDFEFAFEGDEPDIFAARIWGWNHESQDPITQLNAPVTDPVDLDGDGDLDVVVSYGNNGSAEVDAAGAPADDGLDLVGGVGVVIYDGPTGEVLLALPDTFAWGTEDLDGDGVPELITSPVVDWEFGAGISGRQLDCSGPCTAEPVWTDPGRSLSAELSLHTSQSLPRATLVLTEADGDDEAELVVYGAGGPEIVEPDGAGGLTALASVAVPPPFVIEGATGGGVVLSTESLLQSFDTTLAPTSGSVGVPGQGQLAWRAVAITPTGPWVEVVDGVAHWDDPGPVSFELGGDIAFAHDLDGDGLPELVSYANAGVDDAEQLRVRVHEFDVVAGTFTLRWELLADSEPELVGARGGGGIHWAPGNFDGSGSLDVALAVTVDSLPRVAILDGDTGALDAVLLPSGRPASQTGFRPADVVDAGGLPGTDGIDDLLYVTTAQVEILSQGQDQPLLPLTLQEHGYVASWADLDGDGEAELFTTVSSALNNEGEAIAVPGGVPTALWGPVDLGPMTGTPNLLSFSALDAVPGLDILYLNGDAVLTARAGSDGSMLPGYPVYLADGSLPATPPEPGDVPTSIVVLDVDDDGFEEAVIGTSRGWVYALDLDPAEVGAPSLVWSIQVPAGVHSVGAADADGDGFSELILAIDDASVIILDPGAVALEITGPPEVDCYGEAAIEVTGTASGLATVNVFANGLLGEGDIDASSGSWSGTVVLSNAGLYAVRADGFDADGALVAVAFHEIQFEGDVDGDGTTECGGDCAPDDPLQGPLVEEICEDGFDQDCDGEDADCPEVDDDDSAADDDDATPDDDDATAADDDDSAGGAADGCSCDCEGNIGGGQAGLTLLLPLLLGLRRRR